MRERTEQVAWVHQIRRGDATAVVAADRLSRDTLSAAATLHRLGYVVEIHHPEPLTAERQELASEAAAQGVDVLPRPIADRGTPFDVLLIDLSDTYTPPSEPYIVEARRRGAIVTTLADVVLQLRRGPSIGVTGSAGKSTTTLLASHIMSSAGNRVSTPRTIRMENPYPNYEIVDDLEGMDASNWTVAEITSAHLEYMATSPTIAAITCLSPDHADWHGDISGYYGAKTVILRHQQPSDWAIINSDDAASQAHLLPNVQGDVFFFGKSDLSGKSNAVYVHDGRIVARRAGKTLELGRLDALSPQVFVENYLCAAAIALAASVPADEVSSALRAFEAPPHRLQLVGTAGGVSVYSDGMAQTPLKSSAGLSSFEDQSLIVVAGGFTDVPTEALHGADEERELLAVAAATVARKARHAVLIGASADLLRAELQQQGMDDAAIHDAPSAVSAGALAGKLAEAGDAIVFSPVFYVPEAEWDGLCHAALEEVSLRQSSR